MVKIEYNGAVIDAPENWDEVRLGDYERVLNLKPQTARERVEVVANIVKTDANALLGAPAELFNYLVEITQFMFEDTTFEPQPFVGVNGVKYFVSITDDLTLGEWVDIEDAQVNRPDTIMAEILAICCRPAGEDYNPKATAERKSMFEGLPVSAVAGAFAFFLSYSQKLEAQTRHFSELKAQIELSLPLTLSSLNSGVGIRLLATWRGIRYFALMMLLAYRLRRLSRSFNTNRKKVLRSRRKWRWIGSYRSTKKTKACK